MQVAQPARLEKLAMSAACDFLTQLCEKILRVPWLREEEEEYWLSVTNAAIKNIKDLVNQYIPCSIANEWLENILIRLDQELHLEVKRKLPLWGRMLTRQITVAIIPPSVTKLSTHRCNFLVPEIYSALKLMKNLQHIKLGYDHDDTVCEHDYFQAETDELPEWVEDSIISGIKHIKQLVTFSFEHLCTDGIVKVLAEKHPGIRSLDLAHCMYVTDNIITMIPRFQCLQVLFLVWTGLSGIAVTILLRELPNGKALESYSHSDVTEEEIALLVQQCPKLSYVKLYTEGCRNILPLRKLHNLKRLFISDIEFHCLYDVLLILGDQLLELELFSVLHLDVSLVGKTCRSLKYLSLYDCDTPIPVPEEQPTIDPSPPGFMLLKQLKIAEYNYPPLVTYVLGQCLNLKSAYIKVRGDDDNRIIESVLRRNHLSSLEKLRWSSNSTVELSFQAAKNVLEHCHQLHTFVGPHKWRLQSDYEDFLQEIRETYPGCHISSQLLPSL